MKNKPEAVAFNFKSRPEATTPSCVSLLRETSMDGQVQMTMRREPSYFDAAAVDGPAARC